MYVVSIMRFFSERIDGLPGWVLGDSERRDPGDVGTTRSGGPSSSSTTMGCVERRTLPVSCGSARRALLSLGEAGRDPRSSSSLCLNADAAPPCMLENELPMGDSGENCADPGVGDDIGELNALRSGEAPGSDVGDNDCLAWCEVLSSSGGGIRLPSGVPGSLGDELAWRGGSAGTVLRTSSTEDEAVAVDPKRSRPRPKFCRTLSMLGLRPSNGTGGGASRPNADATVYMDPFDRRDAREAIEYRE